MFKVENGVKLQAESILINGTDIKTDEADLTGESIEQEKEALSKNNFEADPCPFMMKSCKVVTGEGEALVCAVGRNTRSGKAESVLNFENDLTPLQMKLETIAN